MLNINSKIWYLFIFSRVNKWSWWKLALVLTYQGRPQIILIKSGLGRKFGLRVLFHLHALANSAMMSTLTVYCQWEDEMARERTGHLASYAEAKKMKLLTLHTHGCSPFLFLSVLLINQFVSVRWRCSGPECCWAKAKEMDLGYDLA